MNFKFLFQNLYFPLQLLLGLQGLSGFFRTEHRLVGDCVPHVNYTARKNLTSKRSNAMVFDLGLEFFFQVYPAGFSLLCVCP